MYLAREGRDTLAAYNYFLNGRSRERVGARSGTTARYTSGRVRVLNGQGLVWTLEANLQQSFLQIVPVIVPEVDSIK